MKKVLILGDSIRLGYGCYVKAVLEDEAEVYSAKENCAFAQYTLRWINEWKIKEGYPDDMDLIHWNVGLWDVLRICGDDTLTSPEFYGETLKRIEKRLRVLFPKAKQVFATSTSVIEEGYTPPYQRYNSDIEKFNKIAVETLAPLGVAINDLYSITKNAPRVCRSDMTHFYTVEGIKLVGEKVVRTICEQLAIPLDRAKDVASVVPSLSQEIIGR
jgi:hypothetical protein